ncbi:MAG TPA: HDIG domain-containing protein [Treponemataceae bacterium]|nr:HDIG domain-containing protein [Treponemataceae bacterium]
MKQKQNSNAVSSENKPAFTLFLTAFKSYVKQNTLVIIIFLAVFFSVVAISFMDSASKETVVSFALEEFEVGQISDRTIIAEKSIAPTIESPLSIIKDEKIIRKGFAITEDAYAKLEKMAKTPSYIDYRSFANSVLFYVLLGALAAFLFSRKILNRKAEPRELLFLSVLFIIVFAITSFGIKIPFFSYSFALPIIIPATLSVMLITVLFGQISAVYFSLLVSFAVLYVSSFDPVPAFFILCSSIAAARIVRKTEKRIDMIFASMILGVLHAIFLFAFKIIFNEAANFTLAIVMGNVFNGFISGILALGLLTPLESILNTSSVFRLMDLSDLNNPMMKKMLLTAPGTYNHSMMVATLAESACSEIGANPLLARVGAYYHDLGKMEQPEYFVENQSGNNKHNEINPRLSASVIRRHVKKGLEKANQLRLPKEVMDIIAEHHGNSLISYFYAEAKKQDDQVSPEEFSYIGTPPSSKESAVVMLADTVEAACRTLDKPSVSRLEKFIRQLIMTKVEHHQLDKSGLTFRDLDIIQQSFVKILAGYYHSRIEYPNQKDPDAGDSPQSEKKNDNQVIEKNQNDAKNKRINKEEK